MTMRGCFGLADCLVRVGGFGGFWWVCVLGGVSGLPLRLLDFWLIWRCYDCGFWVLGGGGCCLVSRFSLLIVVLCGWQIADFRLRLAGFR